ncbi:MAG: hypothetical protein ACFNO4_06030, partial [Dialister invisus]
MLLFFCGKCTKIPAGLLFGVLEVEDLQHDRQRLDEEDAAEVGTSSSLRMMMAKTAMMPPRVRLPVSPMK